MLALIKIMLKITYTTAVTLLHLFESCQIFWNPNQMLIHAVFAICIPILGKLIWVCPNLILSKIETIVKHHSMFLITSKRRGNIFPKTKKLQLSIKNITLSLHIIHRHLATLPLFDHTCIIYVYKHITI